MKNKFKPDMVLFVPGKIDKLAYVIGMYVIVKNGIILLKNTCKNYKAKRAEKA